MVCPYMAWLKSLLEPVPKNALQVQWRFTQELGVSIDLETLDKIFEECYRVPGRTSVPFYAASKEQAKAWEGRF